jgi:hypothetical protein
MFFADRSLADDVNREWNNNVFGVGERFVFDIDYAFINAGRTVMEIDSIINVRGKDCYRLVSKVSSNKTFDLVFKVRDHVESNIDVKGIFTRRYYKELNEGNYHDIKEVLYEQERGLAHMKDEGVYKKSSEIEPCSQDILSSLYYLRTLDFAVGDTISVPLHDVAKSYPLKVKVNREEHVEVPAGEFNCFVVEPFVESEGMFRSKGKIEVWLSKDEKRIPVLMRTYIAIIGHIDANLVEYKLGMPVDLTEN